MTDLPGDPPVDPLQEPLRAIVGPDHVLTDPALLAGYETDWTRRFTGRARLVVRPGTAGEVAAVVRTCGELGAPVVPQGGNTGLVGGAVPDGTVVLSLRRLAWLEPVDPGTSSVTAGAGTTLSALHEAGAPFGLRFGVDLGARESATVGGLIATNAGGVHVLRYGSTRAQLLGIEVVTAGGSLVSRLQPLDKDNAGYDLGALMAGSEGTLGIITAARLRLVPRWPHRIVALVGLASVGAAVGLAQRVRSSVSCLEALEFFMDDALELVLRRFGWPRPLPAAPVYVLVELAAAHDPTDELGSALDGFDDVAVATDASAMERLWGYRESISDAIASSGVPHKLDVGIPLAALPTFVERVRSEVSAVDADARTILFGHLADGNVHVNVLGPRPDAPEVDDLVLSLAVELGGSISAEHGIGRAKREWLSRYRSPADLAAMRSIKAALDPLGLLNPGVLFE